MEHIRKAGKQDCRDVYSLICEMEETALPYNDFKQIYDKQTDDEDYLCLVYETEGKTAGCINLRMERQLHHASRICEIMELSVGGGFRCRGIGRLLFEAACLKAKANGCTQIEVCCNQLRNRAHRFYEAQGMQNFHYKFSLDFSANGKYANRLGR